MSDVSPSWVQRLAGCRVLVVGDVMLDHYVWGDTTRISPEAPVPVVKVFRDSWQAGGAANVALNLAALGVPVTLIGLRGEDETGRRLQSILAGQGVDASGLQVSDTAPTIVKTRVVVQKQQICRIDREMGPEAYTLSIDALGEACEAADAVIVSDYAKGVVSPALLDELTRLCGSSKTLAVDPKPSRRLNYVGASLMTPNRAEALELAEIMVELHQPFPAREVCQAIWDRYRPKQLIVTLGADGMVLAEEGRVIGRLPTRAQEVFDVSGAGDTVIATLSAALGVGASLLEAARLANAAAGVVVSKFGTATVSPAELVVALGSEQAVEPV